MRCIREERANQYFDLRYVRGKEEVGRGRVTLKIRFRKEAVGKKNRQWGKDLRS